VTQLFVARHGETDWNRAGRYQGQLESTLTDLGRRQAGALAQALAQHGIERVVASPLSRCVETAQPLARALRLELETDERLLEIDHGNWSGRLRAEIERDDPNRIRAWRENPQSVQFEGGETLRDVFTRWREFAASLAGGGNVAVVTHDVLVRLAVLDASLRPLSALWKPRVHNGGYAAFERHADRWKLVNECRDAHLIGMLADASGQAL
jgi:broad specificity phosphatase PhoE